MSEELAVQGIMGAQQRTTETPRKIPALLYQRFFTLEEIFDSAGDMKTATIRHEFHRIPIPVELKLIEYICLRLRNSGEGENFGRKKIPVTNAIPKYSYVGSFIQIGQRKSVKKIGGIVLGEGGSLGEYLKNKCKDHI